MIDDDDYFESLIKNSWRAPERVQPKPQQPQNPSGFAPANQNLGATGGLQPEQKTMKNLTVRFADDVNIK